MKYGYPTKCSINDVKVSQCYVNERDCVLTKFVLNWYHNKSKLIRILFSNIYVLLRFFFVTGRVN